MRGFNDDAVSFGVLQFTRVKVINLSGGFELYTDDADLFLRGVFLPVGDGVADTRNILQHFGTGGIRRRDFRLRFFKTNRLFLSRRQCDIGKVEAQCGIFLVAPLFIAGRLTVLRRSASLLPFFIVIGIFALWRGLLRLLFICGLLLLRLFRCRGFFLLLRLRSGFLLGRLALIFRSFCRRTRFRIGEFRPGGFVQPVCLPFVTGMRFTARSPGLLFLFVFVIVFWHIHFLILFLQKSRVGESA